MKSSKFIIPCAFLALAGCNESISCDNPRVLNQVKDMVRSRLTGSLDSHYQSPFVRGRELNQAVFDDMLGSSWTKIALDFTGIRDRGTMRNGGSDCAAIGKLSKAGAGLYVGEDLGVSYKIERDTAGGHVLTVRVSGS